MASAAVAGAATSAAAGSSVRHKFVQLLQNYREPVTDAEVREYFQGEYEKLPGVINALMSEVRRSGASCWPLGFIVGLYGWINGCRARSRFTKRAMCFPTA